MVYMNNIYFFAHADELHDAATSSAEHTLTQPAVAVPLYLLIGVLLYFVLNTYKKTALLPVLLTYNFLCGLMLYSLVPAISIISLSVGIVLALIVALGSIAASK